MKVLLIILKVTQDFSPIMCFDIFMPPNVARATKVDVGLGSRSKSAPPERPPSISTSVSPTSVAAGSIVKNDHPSSRLTISNTRATAPIKNVTTRTVSVAPQIKEKAPTKAEAVEAVKIVEHKDPSEGKVNTIFYHSY